MSTEMPSRCDDCAFRDGSRERADLGGWQIMVEAFKKGVKFFCHKGMPQDEKGAYVPECDAAGVPQGARVCGGWARCHRGEQPWPPALHILTTSAADRFERGEQLGDSNE